MLWSSDVTSHSAVNFLLKSLHFLSRSVWKMIEQDTILLMVIKSLSLRYRVKSQAYVWGIWARCHWDEIIRHLALNSPYCWFFSFIAIHKVTMSFSFSSGELQICRWPRKLTLTTHNLILKIFEERLYLLRFNFENAHTTTNSKFLWP